MSTGPEKDHPEDALEPEHAKPAPKKRAMPPSRIVFLVFVAIAAVVIVVELRARWTFSHTVKQLDEAWEAAQQKGTGIYREDLDKLVCGSPSREYDREKRKEVFTWQGIRTHGLQVLYDRGDFVVSYETMGGG